MGKTSRKQTLEACFWFWQKYHRHVAEVFPFRFVFVRTFSPNLLFGTGSEDSAVEFYAIDVPLAATEEINNIGRSGTLYLSG